MRTPQRFSLILNLVAAGLLLLAALPTGTSAAAQGATPMPFPTFGALPPSSSTPIPGSAVVSGTNTPGPSPTPAPLPSATLIATAPLQSEMMGIQIHPNLQEQQWRIMMDFAQFMGMKWIKVQLSWKELEPQPGQFSQLDSLLPIFFQITQGRNGFRLLLSVAKAPDWARPAGAANDGPPSDPQKLADFLTRAVTVYRLRDQDAIEIWNEPNIAADWSGVPLNAATYMRYFDASYKAIRARLPNIPIITAGLAPTGDGSGSVDDRRWLQEMYNAGLKNYAGVAVGIHPYGWANSPDARCCEKSDLGWRDNRKFFFQDNIEDYRAIMVRNGHGAAKLWATEFGWATYDNLRVGSHVDGALAKAPSSPDLGWMRQLSEAQRSTYTLRAFEVAQNGDYAAFMGPMMLWNLNFADLPGFVSAEQDSRPEAGFSVLNGDGFPRGLYDALQNAPKR